jgi:hypothetical protein
MNEKILIHQPYEAEQILLAENASCLAVKTYLKMLDRNYEVSHFFIPISTQSLQVIFRFTLAPMPSSWHRLESAQNFQVNEKRRLKSKRRF